MSWLKRLSEALERAVIASALAQAGELDMAREVVTEEPAGPGR